MYNISDILAWVILHFPKQFLGTLWEFENTGTTPGNWFGHNNHALKARSPQ